MQNYYYIDEITGQQCGPFSMQELQSKGIRREMLVWRSGMPDWVRADSVVELAFLFNPGTPVPQQQTPGPQNREYQQNKQSGYNRQSGYNDYQNQRRWDGILPMPKNWLIESILFSIFCCSPVSVVGIFYASKVESLYYAKDYDGAMRASNNAKNWTLAGILFLPACYVLFIILSSFLAIFI